MQGDCGSSWALSDCQTVYFPCATLFGPHNFGKKKSTCCDFFRHVLTSCIGIIRWPWRASHTKAEARKQITESQKNKSRNTKTKAGANKSWHKNWSVQTDAEMRWQKLNFEALCWWGLLKPRPHKEEVNTKILYQTGVSLRMQTDIF